MRKSDRSAHVLFAVAFSVLASCSSSRATTPTDSQTHWLEACDRDAQCGTLSCVCGACVSTCAHSGSCAVSGRDASCRSVDSNASMALCGGVAPTSICLAVCAHDRDCLGGEICTGGACVPASRTATASAGGAAPAGTSGSSTIAGGAAGATPPQSNPSDAGSSDASAFAGSWEGYAQAFSFDDGTDSVHLQLNADGTGSFRVGDRDPLPHPMADQPYPPGPLTAAFYAGFEYPISDATARPERLRFSVNWTLIYSAWCKLETPYAAPQLFPPWSCGPSDSPDVGNACRAHCDCNTSTSACDAVSTNDFPLFDGNTVTNPNTMLGTIAYDSSSFNVVLMRAQ